MPQWAVPAIGNSMLSIFYRQKSISIGQKYFLQEVKLRKSILPVSDNRKTGRFSADGSLVMHCNASITVDLLMHILAADYTSSKFVCHMFVMYHPHSDYKKHDCPICLFKVH